jgi:4-aminobutyrate aminotransferase-like enzyme
MIGVELTNRGHRDADQERYLDDGALLLTCRSDGNVLRLIPPLTIIDAELDHGLAILARALTR